jgi:type I restriction-modification system DNA methylase subunit
MPEIFEKYIRSISSKFAHAETSEMGYRTDFEILLKEIFESINVKRIDHDARAKQGNKPDFIILKFDVPILYIETKDIGMSLDKIEKSEQMSRYFGYANLVLTDYVEFRFYRNGKLYEYPIQIATYDIKHRIITALPDNYSHLAKTLVDFSQTHKEPIRTGEHLSKIMGGKAQRIRDNIRQFLSHDSEKNAEIMRVFSTLKKLLVHDLTKDSFADMYAQTLVYGLFVARYYDETSENFTRQEARDLIPKSNPLLRHFFDHIVGPDFDKRLEYIVNELCEVFKHADVPELMKQYFQDDLWGQTHEGPDPVIHFYEDFLKEYDPALRKKLGAYYTPLPVVRFIVRSVDYLLEKEFGLASGLADTSKTEAGLHRVQILDPAAGTGTFISAVIRIIYERLLKSGQKGRWPNYVHHDLLPRLHGFELMMAPYTIAHLKLSMAFKATGFGIFNRRLGIYLTNSLESGAAQTDLFTGFGFAESIAEESKEASDIKNKTPIMVVIGNPPYSGESSNKSYKGNDVYKVEPAGGKLRERNSKWLNNDYVKFIRFAESLVEKTGEGIVAMITDHGYIENPTFRGMRHHLMKTFDDIYILDLHGSSKTKEKLPDGSQDINVFDIQQGVSIIFGIKQKNRSSNTHAKIFRADCFGSRQLKFLFLDTNSLNTVKWEKVVPLLPNYEWISRNKKLSEEYRKGFPISELFPILNVGIVTARDKMSIQYTRNEMEKVIEDFQVLDDETLRLKYDLGKDKRDWKVSLAKKDVVKNLCNECFVPISYRPFDTRWTFYTGNSKGFHCMPRGEIMKHILKGENISFSVHKREEQDINWAHIFVTRNITEHSYTSIKSINYQIPLFLYTDDYSRVSNLKKEIVAEIENVVGKVTPEDIFDYIYAVLHSPGYREKYKEFLKIDFPRVPYPKDVKTFKELIAFGAELRSLHLLESPKVNRFITTYPVAGSDIVEKVLYKNGNVLINQNQCFGNVPESAWNFYIGGYQPAQKWLKDRKGRALVNADIEHYQKIIVALTETDRIMQEIDKIICFS